ncbi:unnamed protein product, partial [marine sediment metagenome]
MAFNVPTITEIKNRIIADMESRMTGNTPLLIMALLRILAIVLAGAFNIVYRFARWISKQIILNSLTETDWLNLHSIIWGVPRKAALFADGSVHFLGDEDTVIPEGTLVENTDGFQYKTTEEITLTTPENGDFYANADVIAVLSGSASNYVRDGGP